MIPPNDDAAVSRRDIFTAGLFAALASAAAPVHSKVIGAGSARVRLGRRGLAVVDLTHELTTQFNWIPEQPRIAMDPIIGSGFAACMNLNRIMLVEHTGTHIDAPRHFARDGRSLGEIPVSDLVVPLAVIDLGARTAKDDNAGLEPADVLAWERRYGRLPVGCCVAINSGYDPLPRIREMASGGRRGSPGFTPEVSDFLIREREVKGIAVDAMSIDQGNNSPAYPVHQKWLRSDRWGIEGLTNLNAVPPSGALLIVGAAPIKDATGFPIRALALFEPG